MNYGGSLLQLAGDGRACYRFSDMGRHYSRNAQEPSAWRRERYERMGGDVTSRVASARDWEPPLCIACRKEAVEKPWHHLCRACFDAQRSAIRGVRGEPPLSPSRSRGFGPFPSLFSRHPRRRAFWLDGFPRGICVACGAWCPRRYRQCFPCQVGVLTPDQVERICVKQVARRVVAQAVRRRAELAEKQAEEQSGGGRRRRRGFGV